MSPTTTPVCEALAEPEGSASALSAPVDPPPTVMAMCEALTIGPFEAEAFGAGPELHGLRDEPAQVHKPNGFARRRLAGAVRAGMTALMGLALLCLCALLLSRFLPYKVQFIRSGSMSPTLPVGSLVAYERVPAGSLRVGDVISITPPGKPGTVVTHRIARVETGAEGTFLMTKGDANRDIDPWRVPPRGTGWRSVASVPKVGFFVGYARSALARPGLIPSLVVIILMMLLFEIWRPSRAARASAL